MKEFKKLKRVVIKEEFVALTGNYIKAILLNQLLYWMERTYDFDKFLEEEEKRLKEEGKELEITKLNGWIYKSSEELNNETMLGLSIPTIRKHLEELVKSGYLEQRTNPNHKWDRTLQYRVNLKKIKEDLEKLGYQLDGFLYRNLKNLKSSLKNLKSSLKNLRAIPEITTEITTDIYNIAKQSFAEEKKEKSFKEENQSVEEKSQIVKVKAGGLTKTDPKIVNEFINLFKPINPAIYNLFGNKTQRASIDRLVQKYGEEKIRNLIKTLPQIVSKPYAPRITTPYQLETKLGDLLLFVAQEKTKGGETIDATGI